MTSLNDVILHPAYVKHVLNKDIERMRVIVSIHDRWQQVTNRVRREKLTVRIPASGFQHYKECVWADPDCKTGPDTCVCSYVAGTCFDIIQLLNSLQNENKTATANSENKKYGFYGQE